MHRSVGPYELQETLGAGALGVTYRARDTRTDTVVALKLIHPHLSRDPDVLARLHNEVRTASQLDHPNIARIIEEGDDDGEPYIVTEHAPGETLRARLRREGRLSEAETHGIALCVAHALNAANVLRVTHRNLTPENILLGEDGQLNVCDFGGTRALDATTPTRAVAFVVAPAYAAPELSDRRGDIRSDLYSLGVMMFEALTGRVALNGDARGVSRKHAMQPPDAPLRRAAPSLARIVQRLLEKDPKDRYDDPEQLLQALQSLGRLAPHVVADAAAPAVTNVTPPAPSGAASDGAPPREAAVPGVAKPRRRFALFGDREGKQLTEYVNRVLEDDVITEDDEKSLREFAASLGIASFDAHPAIADRLIVARANDGRLPLLAAGETQLACRTGEVVHLEVRASLLDGAATGGWRGRGVDFLTVRGARYHTGLGANDMVGTTGAAVDTGILSVTSQRVVFSGATTTQESLYSRLEFLRVYADALGIAVSDRQNRSTYRLLRASGEVVAAVINAAVQRLGDAERHAP